MMPGAPVHLTAVPSRKFDINGVAEEYLEDVEGLVDRAGQVDVPLVEPQCLALVALGGSKVRSEARLAERSDHSNGLRIKRCGLNHDVDFRGKRRRVSPLYPC